MSNDSDQQHDRRTVLLGAGTAEAQAQGRVDQEVMTITYANGPDVRFDFDYYVNTHMPRIMRLYGKAISRFELRRGLPGTDGAPPQFVATISIWIADGKAFDEAQVKYQPEPRADVSKFTNAVLQAQRDRIVGTASS